VAESTTKVVVHQLLIFKMQSGVNLNEVVVVGYGKTTSQTQELLNKLKLKFWSVKTLQIFLKHPE
jgi:hypothetical protein